MRISDWSSDVCSSDLTVRYVGGNGVRLDQRSGIKAHILGKPMGVGCRNVDPLLEATVTVHANHLQLCTDVGTTDPAGIALNAIDDGVDRKSVVKGKSVSLRVDLGGCRNIKKNK